jgi:hypothetical protein
VPGRIGNFPDEIFELSTSRTARRRSVMLLGSKSISSGPERLIAIKSGFRGFASRTIRGKLLSQNGIERDSSPFAACLHFRQLPPARVQ